MPKLRPHRGTALAVTVLGALALTVGASLASSGGLAFHGCIASAAAHGCTAPAHDSLTNAQDVAVSPDGKSVYVVSGDFSSGAITRFSRAADGSLTYEDCIADAGANGCAAPAHDSLGSPAAVAISADGTSVYVAAYAGDSITRFSRAADGSLTYEDCIANGGFTGCVDPPNEALGGAYGVAVSRDDKSVYVVSGFSSSSSISRFDRAADGSLTYEDCIANGGQNGCTAAGHDSLEGAEGVAVSRDGNSVYVASPLAGSITRFNRAADGSLTYEDCIADAGANGCVVPAHDSLAGAAGVTVSPNGNSVYVASGADAISRLNRAADGSLTYEDCIANAGKHGCTAPGHNSLGAAASIAVSADKKSLYVASVTGNSISRFDRAADGSLTHEDCVADAGQHGCTTPAHNSLDGAIGVAVSPDSQSVYAASANANSITAFETPPKTRLNSAKIKSVKRSATFKFSSNEAGSSFLCKLDHKPYGPCHTPRTYKHLKKGKHTFKVEAKSSAGGIDPSPAKKKFRIKG
ncbi:MAG: 6-phosphogluconolactonase [Solirubrobacterales bacterium]|jgi:DNA-binding beta-propeller fold protein YncE|nr:6-phosphogluconolactonase [Solirubrobacterales bacterium]